ncbi:MAG: flagellar export protein FliJ [Lachnospiraceae bacterium]|nr:flagellar export protein FliJ [Lachnospiraceae bacterium]
MSKFKYRMQNILELKQKMEDQSKMAYANQRRALTKEEEKEEALKDEKQRYEEEGRRLRGNNLNVRDILANVQGVKTMDILIEKQHKNVIREEEKLEKRRKELEKVMKERKAQEKLRENAFRRFVQEENAAEGKVIDELTSYNYGNKRKESEHEG